MPGLATTTDDSTLGCPRSCRSARLGGGNRACLQGCLSHAFSAYWNLHGVADPQPRQAFTSKETKRNWTRGRRSERADLIPPLTKRAVAEALGTAFLLATIIGSGVMAQRLSGGNDALALLCNT